MPIIQITDITVQTKGKSVNCIITQGNPHVFLQLAHELAEKKAAYQCRNAEKTISSKIRLPDACP